VEAIAEHLGFRGRAGRLLIEATLVSDRMEQDQRGERPRFNQHRGGFSLAEREVSGEIIALEQQVVEAVAKLRRLAEQKLVRRMRSLDLKSLAKLVALYLRRFGFGEAEPVERGGDDELHLSVQDRRRGGRFRTAIVVRRDGGKPLTAEAVTELRGALHHYLSTRGMIITSGQISDEAKVEAEVQNLAPIALVDGESLARELIRFGVGVRERSVRLPVLDEALLAELGG
jgi:restriction endonuclease Mrr